MPAKLTRREFYALIAAAFRWRPQRELKVGDRFTIAAVYAVNPPTSGLLFNPPIKIDYIDRTTVRVIG